MVLLEEEHFCDVCLRTPKIHDKSGFEGPKTCPGPFKIESGATQNLKKTTNMREKSARIVQEAAKTKKKTPKSEKCANMDPTWPRPDLEFGRSWPPLSMSKQYVLTSNSFSGI